MLSVCRCRLRVVSRLVACSYCNKVLLRDSTHIATSLPRCRSQFTLSQSPGTFGRQGGVAWPGVTLQYRHTVHLPLPASPRPLVCRFGRAETLTRTPARDRIGAIVDLRVAVRRVRSRGSDPPLSPGLRLPASGRASSYRTGSRTPRPDCPRTRDRTGGRPRTRSCGNGGGHARLH